MNRILSRRSVLKSAVSAASMACAGPLFRHSRPPQPNIIFMLADDLRYDAVGYRNKKVQTPNLDSLASDGLRFHNAFVTTSVCAISRASIFTGMYARRHGICNFTTPLSFSLLNESYPALLRRAGYRTAFFGKYGVGDLKIDMSDEVLDAQLQDRDLAAFDVIEDYGFSYFLGRDKNENHVHNVLARRAEEFILSSSPEQPFCLSLSFVSPHDRFPPLPGYDTKENVMPARLSMPAEPDLLELYDSEIFPEGNLENETAFRSLPEFIQKSFDHTRWSKILSDPAQRLDYLRRYYALISGIDRVIGRVLRALNRINAMSSTALIFTSDNGLFLGDYQLHEKYFGYESSIRIPLMIRPPGGGISRDITDVALNIDIAPTVLALAGIPAAPRMQGRDLTTLWMGSTNLDWRTDFLYEHFLCGPSGRPEPGSQREKNIPSSEGVRNERYTYLRYPYQQGDNETLFDRATDPNQLKNIIHSVPADLISKLRNRTDELIELNT